MSDQRVLLVKTDAQKEKASDRVVYLGPWCRDAHKGLGHPRTLPHHLDSLESVDRLHELSSSLFEIYSRQLATILNHIHDVRWSDRAWQILIGPWLTVFLDVVIDRFETISQLRSQPFEFYTDATSYPYGTWAPLDTDEFIALAADSNQFNEYLFGNILVESPETRNVVVGLSQDVRVPVVRDERPSGLRLVILGMLGNTLGRLSRRVTFVDTYFHPFDQAVLELKLGQIPLLFVRNIGVQSQPIGRAMRQRVNVRPHLADSLNATICRLLPELLPKLYLEEFKRYLEAAVLQYPRKTRMIVTAAAYSFNEGFRFWAASQIDSGTQLVCVQHGGGYGVGLRWSALQHEFRVADYYCTSGWVSQQRARTVPMPIPKLATSKKTYAATLNNKGRGLWIWRAIRRYPFRIAEGSIRQDTAEYLEDQRIFGHALQDSIRSLFTLRLRSPDDAWGAQDLARQEFPEMLLDECRIPFKIAARDSRLWIITNNGTSLFEAMVANVPFVAFWNPDHCINKLSDDAALLFDKLKRCGVFHVTPGSAAETVNEHFGDPARWWRAADIQWVRREFCERFAVTRGDWLDVWAKKIRELL